MRFERLREEAIKEIVKVMPNIENEEQLKKELSFNGKEYKGDYETQRKKLLTFIDKGIQKRREEVLNKILEIEQADDFSGELVITIEWKKSYMWGSNPKAYTNFGFEGESIGGCGYCKTSTATAQALNSYLPLMKMLFKKEEQRIKNLEESKMTKEDKEKFLGRRAFIGYGSGYYALPKFEGGVGVSSHQSIVENLNLKWKNITSTSQTDVYLITK